MRIVSALCLCLSLLASHGFAGQPLAADVFKTLKAQANIQDSDIVYVDFWASWCKPCRASFPWMNSMQDKYRAKGFKVIAINLDTERALAEGFLKSTPSAVDILFDPAGKYAKAFDLQGMPSSYLMDGKGQIRFAHKGFFEDKQDKYEAEIVSLLSNR